MYLWYSGIPAGTLKLTILVGSLSSYPAIQNSHSRAHPYKKSPDSTTVVAIQNFGVAFRKPDQVPDWSVALDRCRHLKEARVAARHVYPPSHLFAKVNDHTRLRYLVNWLAVRKQWFAHVHASLQASDFSEVNLTRQDWRHMLSHRPERGTFLRNGHPSPSFFDLVLPTGAPPIRERADLLAHTWFGRTLDPLKAEDNVVTQRLILWELDEWTFRHEFFELDHYLSLKCGRSDETIAHRRALIMRMWAGYPLDSDNHFLYEPDLDRGINRVPKSSHDWTFSKIPCDWQLRPVAKSQNGHDWQLQMQSRSGNQSSNDQSRPVACPINSIGVY
ncbi:hypothetical protein SISNIDRAFT_466717 [Sistotremastrum niveocremeum HHB9708]|uniref:Uncharacterized protein n=1 Tax=Sistotremastrum niveocremeum HHB9708 TaxID=1314777 RepID=A0A164U2J0_9AGAM|nr:hypothetical protein SISNIDRAFT_466717 [Sistotremastrum niveocremeum HHB9708]